MTTTGKIYIISGEGDLGTDEEYTGRLSVRALKARLTRERCGGDRWARCESETPTWERRPGSPEECLIEIGAARWEGRQLRTIAGLEPYRAE